MTVYIYTTAAGPRSENAARSCIVVNERHDNTCFSILVLDCLKVFTIRKCDIRSSLRVLVLRLKENDRPPVGNLCSRDDLPYLSYIAVI